MRPTNAEESALPGGVSSRPAADQAVRGRLATPGRRARRPSSSGAGSGPLRTCVGCRATAPRYALLRVVASTTGTGTPVLVVDTGRRMPGRGAWLHPDPHCLELAERRRAFGRALRVPGLLDVTVVRRHLEGSEQDPTGPVPEG